MPCLYIGRISNCLLCVCRSFAKHLANTTFGLFAWTRPITRIFRFGTDAHATERIFVIMEEPHTREAEPPAIKISSKRKVYDLPLLCVETVFKFTPTSKLTRLYSNDVPLPGAFWQFGLEAALKKRLPLSLGDDRLYKHADCLYKHADYYPWYCANDYQLYRKAVLPSALFDASGAIIAHVKVPEAFSDSPLCDLIRSAVLDSRVIGHRQSLVGGRVQSVKAEAVLLSLPKIVELTLFDVNIMNKDLLLTNLKHLLPHLQSFTIGKCPEDPFISQIVEFMLELPISEMTSLQRLDIPERTFFQGLMHSNDYMDLVVRQSAYRVLSGLRSLSIWRCLHVCQKNAHSLVDVRLEMLRFVRVRCTNLSTLHLFVDFVDNTLFKHYLAAFRALTSLTTLGMDLFCMEGVIFNKDETINTVVDLRLMYPHFTQRSKIFSVASLFPAAKAVAFQSDDKNTLDALDLASEFCTKRVLPQVTRLNCFSRGRISISSSEQFMDNTAFELVAQFIANPHLAEEVDLSQIIFDILVQERGLLTAIYKAMQANSITSLVMRGPFNLEALTELQRHIDSNCEIVSVTAWKDRDLGEQPGVLDVEEISPQTDVIIVGRKISGVSVGEKFSIRIVHQLTKWRYIFD